MRFYVVVEGHGEPEAILNLLHRLQGDLKLSPAVWGRPIRKVVTNRPRAEEVAGLVRGRGDAAGLLITRDGDDDCPRDSAPELATWLKGMGLPFPVAVVLFHREYETLFLPCVSAMAGQPLEHHRRPGLVSSAQFDGDFEAVRDAKGKISSMMPSGRVYKPTTDQLALTQMLDFSMLRTSELPCFGTLERALTFLLSASSSGGQVFPIDR